jgi:hypothetical protein
MVTAQSASVPTITAQRALIQTLAIVTAQRELVQPVIITAATQLATAQAVNMVTAKVQQHRR